MAMAAAMEPLNRSPSRLRRLVVIVSILTLALPSLLATVAGLVGKAAPHRALQLWPFDGRINSAAATATVRTGEALNSRGPLSHFARKALAQDPTTASAAGVIGLQKELRGDHKGALQAFTYAARLSARELETHLWAINNAAQRGDLATVFSHYDMALRTSRQAPELLFPVLANALSDKLVREHLSFVASDAPWRRDFLVYAAQRGPQIDATMTFFAEGPQKGLPVEADVKDALVTSAFNRGMHLQAWNYFLQQRSPLRPNRSTDPSFSAAGAANTPFDWRIPETALADARFERTRDGSSFAYQIAADFSGPILQQVTALAPGRYRIEKVPSQPQRKTVGVTWAVTCLISSRPVARIPDAENDTSFTVPAGCPFQMLMLEAGPVRPHANTEGAYKRVEVVPI